MLQREAMTAKRKALTGEQLKRMRERAGMTQQALADLLGVHRQTVTRWENGAAEIPTLAAISARWLLRPKPKLADPVSA